MPTQAEITDSILLAVEAIPVGQVSTYGDIGRVVGCGPRLVARVLAASEGTVCWWRVIRSDGRIVPQLIGEAVPRLVSEGVSVANGRVDLSQYRAVLE